MTSSITTHHNRPSVSELSAALDEYRRKAEQAGIRPGDPLHAWVEATDRLFEGMAARLDENETRQDDSLQKLHEAVYKITQISLLLTKPSPVPYSDSGRDSRRSRCEGWEWNARRMLRSGCGYATIS